jgi:hypothetical protein
MAGVTKPATLRQVRTMFDLSAKAVSIEDIR